MVINKSLFFLLVTGIAASLLFSCEHPISEHELSGGKGGQVVLMMTPELNGKNVFNGKAYIKYAASYAPKDGIYNDSTNVVTINSIPYAVFGGLSMGDYYVNIKAYDSSSARNISGGTIYLYVTKDDTVKQFISMNLN